MKTPNDFIGPSMPVAVTCAKCGEPFHIPPGLLFLARLLKHCGLCSDAIHTAACEEARAKARASNTDSGWNRLCPAGLRDTDPSKLPNIPAHMRAMSWKYGPFGLIFIGPTGRGKTRAMYSLLKREHEDGKTFAVCDHSSGYQYAEVYSIGPVKAREWLEHRATVDILALDDLFKAKLTESFEQAVFAIISLRTERGLPVILTTNDVGETLQSRMSADRGPALIRRLREFCKPISF